MSFSSRFCQSSFFFQHSVVNRGIAAAVLFFRPDWDPSSIYGWLFFLWLFILPLALLSVCPPLFGLLLRPRTTVWFFADRVELRHLRFFRRRFHRLAAPDAEFVAATRLNGITVLHTPDQNTHVSSDETHFLVLRYGLNDVPVARFVTEDKAVTFAAVLNAALQQSWAQPAAAVGRVTVRQLRPACVTDSEGLPPLPRPALRAGNPVIVRRRHPDA